MKIQSNKLYDALKFTAQILLPALGGLYFGLADIFGLPAALEVVGILAVIDTVIGVLLHVSSEAFTINGAIRVTENAGVKTYSLELAQDPDELDNKSEVRFKVIKTENA